MDDLEKEYKYFTLRKYLKLNDESKQGLERLCQLYSPSATKYRSEHLLTDEVPKEMTDREKVLLINEFIGRSEAWTEKIE